MRVPSLGRRSHGEETSPGSDRLRRETVSALRPCGLSDSHATAVRAASLKEIPGERGVASAFSPILFLNFLTCDIESGYIIYVDNFIITSRLQSPPISLSPPTI